MKSSRNNIETLEKRLKKIQSILNSKMGDQNITYIEVLLAMFEDAVISAKEGKEDDEDSALTRQECQSDFDGSLECIAENIAEDPTITITPDTVMKEFGRALSMELAEHINELKEENGQLREEAQRAVIEELANHFGFSARSVNPTVVSWKDDLAAKFKQPRYKRKDATTI